MEADVKTDVSTMHWHKLGEDGTLMGQISITIGEEEDVRESRDSALLALEETLKIVKQLKTVETKLCKRVADAQQTYMKEREEHTKERLGHAKTKNLLAQNIEGRERLTARVIELQAQLKAANEPQAKSKAKGARK